MWLIVGLGNPGRKYANTRHNLGFMVVDAISSRFSIPLKNKSKSFVYGRGFIGGKKVLLIKPLTYMNRSGKAVRDALDKYPEIDVITTVHDDLDLAPGVIKIKKKGSSGGHRGIESVIEAMGTKNFLRIKVGIGHPDKIPPERYVLCSFDRGEKQILKKAVEKAVEAVVTALDKGVSFAQNVFN